MSKTFTEEFMVGVVGWLLSLVACAFIAYVIGFFIEEGQAGFFKIIRSKLDEWWTALGGPFAVIVFTIFPSTFIYQLCGWILWAILGYVLWCVYYHRRTILERLNGPKK